MAMMSIIDVLQNYTYCQYYQNTLRYLLSMDKCTRTWQRGCIWTECYRKKVHLPHYGNCKTTW